MITELSIALEVTRGECDHLNRISSQTLGEVTSATEGGWRLCFHPLCVYLCAGYLKKMWTDLDEIWWLGWVCDKDEVIRFW